MNELKQFLKNRRNLLSVIGLILMVAIIPLAVELTNIRQIFFSQASGTYIAVGDGNCVVQTARGEKALKCGTVPLVLINPFATPNSTPNPSEPHIYGVNGNSIFYRKGEHGTWAPVGGSLKQVSSGLNGDAWGVNSADQIWRKVGADGTWINVAGSLKQIDVDCSGGAWGVNSADQIWYINGPSGAWTQIPGSLKNIAAGRNEVWGVNSADQIWYKGDINGTWVQVPGSLKQIEVACNGEVWGVNSSDQIFYRSGIAGNWQPVEGSLKQVSVGADNNVWGVNAGKGIYFRKGIGGTWQPMDGALDWVSVGLGDGTVAPPSLRPTTAPPVACSTNGNKTHVTNSNTSITYTYAYPASTKITKLTFPAQSGVKFSANDQTAAFGQPLTVNYGGGGSSTVVFTVQTDSACKVFNAPFTLTNSCGTDMPDLVAVGTAGGWGVSCATPAPPVACQPPPNMGRPTMEKIPGGLRVTRYADTNANTPTNILRGMNFTGFSNIRVDFNGKTYKSPANIDLRSTITQCSASWCGEQGPNGAKTVVFAIYPTVPGQGGTLSFTMEDSCRQITDFVGSASASTFGAGSPPAEYPAP